MPLRRWVGAAAASLLVGSLVAVTPAGFAGEPDSSGGPAARTSDGAAARTVVPAMVTKPRTVTLITGDAVHLTGDRITVEPAAGRRGVPMLSSRINGHTFVVPADAEPLVRRGTVDRHLFDVTGLLAAGYDDASMRTLPIIVQYEADRRTAALRSATGAGGRQGRTFRSIDAAAVAQPKKSTASLWHSLVGSPTRARAATTVSPGIRHVWLDRKLKISSDVSAAQIKAPAAWAAGHTGKGVKVAVLDTGYDPTHPDLKDVVTASANFTVAPDVVDREGHGTHVASIVAGSGAASQGRHRGVSPGAELIVGKVCPDAYCPTSAILAGMDWAAEQGAKVVNLSLGGLTFSGVNHPEVQAVERLTRDKGMLFVAAAGNDGPSGWVGSPSIAPSAISVASVDSGDRMASTSTWGPTLEGGLKPDVAAPGAGIVAAKAADTAPDVEDPYYLAMSGTSMATPHVSGAAAILFSRHRTWSPQQVKAALLATARPAADGGVWAYGTGIIDVAGALDQTVLAEPSSVDFGRVEGQAGDLSRTVTYRNVGADPVTVTLDLQITERIAKTTTPGRPRPDLLALNARELTVPAGGTASATLTTNLDELPDVEVGGWLTASAGGTVVARTAVGAVHRRRLGIVEVSALDRNGAVNDRTVVRLINRDTGRVEDIRPRQGQYPQIAVPEGSYDLMAAVFTPQGTAPASWTLYHQPAIEVRYGSVLTIDARRAVPLTFDTGTPGLQQHGTMVNMDVSYPGGVESLAVSAGTAPSEQVRDLYVVPGVADERLSVTTRTTLVQPVDGKVDRSPVVYHLMLSDARRLSGSVTVDPDRLLTVRSQYAEHVPGEPNTLNSSAMLPEYRPNLDLSGPSLPVAPPLDRTEYFTAAPMVWIQDLCQNGPGEPEKNCLSGGVQDHAAGSRIVRRWNGAVFGPALFTYAGLFPERTGEYLSLGTSLMTDGSIWHYSPDNDVVGTMRLMVDGEVIDSDDRPHTDFVAAGTRSGTFRLEVDVARPADGPARPTTRATVAWTFRSDFPGESETRMLPILAVRLTPEVDLSNRAPAGQAFTVPLEVQRAPGMPATAEVTLEASYDDGTTWHRAEVAGADDTWTARLTHPESAGHVSLRTTAVDREGNAVEQTMMRAYSLR